MVPIIGLTRRLAGRRGEPHRASPRHPGLCLLPQSERSQLGPLVRGRFPAQCFFLRIWRLYSTATRSVTKPRSRTSWSTVVPCFSLLVSPFRKISTRAIASLSPAQGLGRLCPAVAEGPNPPGDPHNSTRHSPFLGGTSCQLRGQERLPQVPPSRGASLDVSIGNLKQKPPPAVPAPTQNIVWRLFAERKNR